MEGILYDMDNSDRVHFAGRWPEVSRTLHYWEHARVDNLFRKRCHMEFTISSREDGTIRGL